MNKSLLSMTTGVLLPFAVRVCPGAEGDLLASASARIEKVRKAPVILRGWGTGSDLDKLFQSNQLNQNAD